MTKRKEEPKRGALRCAIYTRKSNEEGLEQEFNSLHAQREACEAYVKSQVGEGWRLHPAHYDDGGFSGGNMDRPGLAKLLADVDAGKVDIIVVYKVDRLTRSLMDFARIVERLDVRSVSFVSVTQAFNTTTSMGRLTLNILLSFAQFEREVTGERIRDKIAASKAKGMWMGGNVPLGYDVADRALVPNASEVQRVRHVFERYLDLQSVTQVAEELDRAGVRSKSWTSRDGKIIGGMRLRPGAICYILQNRLYLGEVVHKGQFFKGNHEPIIDVALFDAVQEIFAQNRRAHRVRQTRAASSPLAGLVFESDGAVMLPTFGYGRGKKVYRYYVSACPSEIQSWKSRKKLRVSASELEGMVLDRLGKLIGSDGTPEWPVALQILRRVEVRAAGFSVVLDLAPGAIDCDPEGVCDVIRPDETSVEGEHIRIEVRHLWATKPARTVSGQFTSNVDNRSKSEPLADLLRASHKRLAEHHLSPFEPNQHACGTAPSDQRTRQILAIGLLAPDVQAVLLDAKLNSALSPKTLLRSDLPLAWSDQRALLV